MTTSTEPASYPAPKSWLRIALTLITRKTDPAVLNGLAGNWKGHVDLTDPNATTVLTLTDEDGEYEIRFRPSSTYRPTF